MRKQYQKSWHDIKFKNFIKTSTSNIAGQVFYDSFYEEFYKNFKSYDDISREYIEKKMCVVEFLEDKFISKKSVLSIGCGIGLIEKILLERNNFNKNFIAIEPSAISVKWISQYPGIKIYNGYFPEVLADKNIDFDFAYARAIDYIFNKKEYIAFLKSIIGYGVSEFTVISVCIDKRSLDILFKDLLKIFLSKFNLYDLGQFWGYLRTEKDHRDSFHCAGFRKLSIEYLDQSTVAITGRI
tara:strand:+ start:230 stop:949 length:720 start_codon:yes stop_codon:yes gene_type:complete